MADSVRSDAYISCIKEFLDDKENANFVIQEIDKNAKNLTETSTKSNNNLVERKQFFKNGIISDYVYEVLTFASKSNCFKFFTSITHERRVMLKYHAISKGFVNRFKTLNPESSLGEAELLGLFKIDFKEQIKQSVKLINLYKLIKKRKTRFVHLVNELKKVQEKGSQSGISPELRQAFVAKVSRLNKKHQVVFMYKKINLLEEMQSELNEYINWLKSDNNFFKITKTNYGFLNMFVFADDSSKNKIITLDKFQSLLESCFQGLDYYKKVMDDYGYKISNDRSEAATAINTATTILSSKKLSTTCTKKTSSSSKSTSK